MIVRMSTHRREVGSRGTQPGISGAWFVDDVMVGPVALGLTERW